jgi:hypothetical protein
LYQWQLFKKKKKKIRTFPQQRKEGRKRGMSSALVSLEQWALNLNLKLLT